MQRPQISGIQCALPASTTRGWARGGDHPWWLNGHASSALSSSSVSLKIPRGRLARSIAASGEMRTAAFFSFPRYFFTIRFCLDIHDNRRTHYLPLRPGRVRERKAHHRNVGWLEHLKREILVIPCGAIVHERFDENVRQSDRAHFAFWPMPALSSSALKATAAIQSRRLYIQRYPSLVNAEVLHL